MAKEYCAFLLRCWRLGTDAQRVEVTHIQSGERALVASLAAALDWLRARAGDGSAARPASRDGDGSEPPERGPAAG